MGARFRDRADAGRQLSSLLDAYAGRQDVLVLGLPRGGVPVAFAVAKALQAPLDVFLVRKLGVPGHEELAMGAVAMEGVRVLNRDVVDRLRVPPSLIEEVTDSERRVLEERATIYRGDRPAPAIAQRIVIVVDDGLATGASMRAAVTALRQHDPARLVVAVPVAAAVTCSEMQEVADEVVCLATPEPFYAVSMAYENFSQTTDDEVRRLLVAQTAE